MADKLHISSCMAPNMDFLAIALAKYLSARLDIPAEAQLDIPWQERERRLDAGQIDLCWICGLPYVWKADQETPRVRLVAAPVMRLARYQDAPIYFSDVVVRRGSPYHNLADLRGASWAYNEPGSQSGYNVTRYTLAVRGETGGFFGRAVASGAHQTSLQMILRGEVDASAIDSTVLERELLDDPSIEPQIRIIDTFGPSPIPPWVAPIGQPTELSQRLRGCLLDMETDSSGQQILVQAGMARFAAVSDADYDPIREMDRIAQGVRLEAG
jgi:phosphonate transport system substrate-binding protein